MTEKEALNWIHSFKANGRRPDLRRMHWLLEKLGCPQEEFPAVHVVGTNGKGSTVSFLQHILTTSGYKTGTFTSPYITRFNERLAIDGHDISNQDLIATVQCIRKTVESLPRVTNLGRATEFEVVTLLMFVYFARIRPIDIAIIEAGIGGLRDSTNVFTALAVICTSISYDHQDRLGWTLAEIAQQKVGVLNEKVPLILGQIPAETKQIFSDRAASLSCPIFELDHDFSFKDGGHTFDFTYQDISLPDLSLSMLGKHQKANASLAIMTSILLAKDFLRITPDTIKKGLEASQWPGRCELMLPNLLIDGAHNEDSLAKLIEVLRDYFSHQKIHILFAGLKRKPLASMLKQLADFEVHVTSFDFPQALPLSDYPPNYPQVQNWQHWLDKASEQTDQFYVVTGSLYFISEVRNYLLVKKKL